MIQPDRLRPSTFGAGRVGYGERVDSEAYASSVARLPALGPRRVLFAHDERKWHEAS